MIHDLAVYRHEHKGDTVDPEQSTFSGAFYLTAGLPILGGCMCGTTVAAYNAFPSRTGMLGCRDCIGDQGYATVEEANADIFPEEVEA